MSQANVELVQGVYEVFGRGDVDAVFAAMEPEIEWDECEGMPYGGVYRGREAIVGKSSGRSSPTWRSSRRIPTRSCGWMTLE